MKPTIAERMRELIAKNEAYDLIIEQLESQLSDVKAQKKELLFTDMPAFLVEHGLQSFKSASGHTYRLATFVTVKVLDQPGLIGWLKGRGYDDDIRHSIDINVKGIDTTELEQWIKGGGLSYDKQEKIHHQTLTALMRRRLEMEVDIPDAVEVDAGPYVVVR
ncbi:MAG: hypothetical protein ACREXR_00650 [Gammaproteobacteria bacterium]